jgi:hypothetical protein
MEPFSAAAAAEFSHVTPSRRRAVGAGAQPVPDATLGSLRTEVKWRFPASDPSEPHVSIVLLRWTHSTRTVRRSVRVVWTCPGGHMAAPGICPGGGG